MTLSANFKVAFFISAPDFTNFKLDDCNFTFHIYTLLDCCLKLYTTLWNIWTYQQLCKKITQLVYNLTQVVYNFTQVVYFFYTTVGRFICFTVLCKLFKQWSNSVGSCQKLCAWLNSILPSKLLWFWKYRICYDIDNLKVTFFFSAPDFTHF